MSGSTARAKTERLLNLVIALLHTRTGLTKQDLRRMVADYRAGEDATFERMFERDKDELRQLGIPVQTVTIDSFFDDELGYRIDPGHYALPRIDFEPDELAVLGLAARMWGQASLSGAAQLAVRKLEAAEVGGEAELGERSRSWAGLEPSVRTPEAAFEPLRRAVLEHKQVSFHYRRPNSETTVRTVQPWTIASWHGHWYLAGHDVDRDGPRVFRLGRIVGTVKVSKKAGAYDVPDDIDVWAMLRQNSGAGDQTARLLVRDGAGHRLRARGNAVTGDPDASGEAPAGWSRWELHGIVAEDLADELAGFGADVIVESPLELRDAVVAALKAVAAAHRQDSQHPGIPPTLTADDEESGHGDQ